FFFFFQAEDGIRDKLVTGVQTCALPICPRPTGCLGETTPWLSRSWKRGGCERTSSTVDERAALPGGRVRHLPRAEPRQGPDPARSEERRVGKECRSRWSTYH